MRKIIEPLAQQLKEENETLTETEFVKAMEDLYELSSYNEKRILIEYYKNLKFQKNFTSGRTPQKQALNEENKCFDEHLSLKILDTFSSVKVNNGLSLGRNANNSNAIVSENSSSNNNSYNRNCKSPNSYNNNEYISKSFPFKVKKNIFILYLFDRKVSSLKYIKYKII